MDKFVYGKGVLPSFLNELIDRCFGNPLTEDPATAEWGTDQAGYGWFNTTEKVPKFWDGTQVCVISTASELAAHISNVEMHVPSGLICMWHGLIANIPSGWLLCNGSNGTPDLREKFVRGAPNAVEAGGTGGEDTHTLTIAELPSHTHGYESYVKTAITNQRQTVQSEAGAFAEDLKQTRTSGATGSGTAYENRPAYYQVLYIMKS